MIRSSLNLNQNAAPAETDSVDTQLPTNAMATNSGVAEILAPSDTIESAAQMVLPAFNNEHSSLMPSDGSIDVGGDSTAMDGKITPSSDFIFSPISAAEAHAGEFFRPGEADQDLINYLDSELSKPRWETDTQAIFERIQTEYSKDLNATLEELQNDGKLAGVISSLIRLDPYPSDQMGHLLANLISALPGDPKLKPVIETFVKMLNIPYHGWDGVIIKCMNYLAASPADLNNLPPDMLLNMSKAVSNNYTYRLENFTANRTVEIAYQMQTGQTQEQATASVDDRLVHPAAVELASHDFQGFLEYFSQNPQLTERAVSYIGYMDGRDNLLEQDFGPDALNYIIGKAVQNNFDLGALLSQMFTDIGSSNPLNSLPAKDTMDKLLTLLTIPDGQPGISSAEQSQMKQMADDYVWNMVQDISKNYGARAVEALGNLTASDLAKMLAILTQTNDPQNQDAIHKVQAAYDIALKRG